MKSLTRFSQPMRRWMLVLISAGGLSAAGCIDTDDASMRNFRDAAAVGLRTGLTAISSGVINGVIDAWLTDNRGDISGEDSTSG